MKSALTSTAILAAAAPLPGAEPARASAAREYYELRRYFLRRGPMLQRFEDFYRHAAIPAFKRNGTGPIGVFNVLVGPDNPCFHALIPHRSLESLLNLGEKMRGDAQYQKAGTSFINASPGDPSYLKVESSLLGSISGLPALELPKKTEGNQPRVFELRTYESHSKKANLTKIKMFNEGEIAIFRRTGLTPVFFGETLVGPNLPNLAYMLVFESLAERERNWSTFIGDPEWKKLSTTPGYTDPEIVTRIHSSIMRPTAFSEI